ncbi:MAG: aminotransferase class V-fold PLP-dependent enzyme, partial [Bacteroidota bacterium]
MKESAKTISLTSVLSPAQDLLAFDPGKEKEIDAAFAEMRGMSPEDAARSESHWELVRHAYDFPTDYINLENGYYSPTPRRIMKVMLDESVRVNRGMSYYMRKEKDGEKEEIRRRLAEFAGISAEECALVGSTTEALDTVIAGMPWKAGDEVVITPYDYGSMLEALEQRVERHG